MAARPTRQLIETGTRAPDFRLQRLGAGEVPLGELLSNGPVLLVFFKVTCPVCQLTLPFLERINTSRRLPVIAISQNGAEDTLEFNRHFGISFPVLLDAEDASYPVSNAYGISSVPTAFLIERDGVVSRVIEGWQKNEVERIGGIAGVNPFRAGEQVPEWKSG